MRSNDSSNHRPVVSVLLTYYSLRYILSRSFPSARDNPAVSLDVETDDLGIPILRDGAPVIRRSPFGDPIQVVSGGLQQSPIGEFAMGMLEAGEVNRATTSLAIVDLLDR